MKSNTKSKKNLAAVVDLLTIGMSTALVLDNPITTGDPSLDALMAELNTVELPADDELVLSKDFETELESAVSSAELTEAYSTVGVEAISDAVAPTAASDEEKASAKKAAKEANKTEKEAARALKKAAKDSEPKVERAFYGLDKVKRLSDRGVAVVLLKADEALTGDDLAAKQKETIDIVAGASQKVKNRTTNILEFVTGRTAVLNNVIRVIFNIVNKEGVLSTGEKGNMFATLGTCYSVGTIRAAGNNSVAALRALKVIVQNEKGEYVANPDSALYDRIKGRLGMSVELATEDETAPE